MKHDCPDCHGRGYDDDPDLPLNAMPPQCTHCKGKGTVKRFKRNGYFTETPREVRMGTDRVLVFEPAPYVERSANSFTEAELAEIELRHGWKVKR